MNNRRFSLFSLLLIVSLVASCLAWFVARRQVEQHAKAIEKLQVKHSDLRDATGQIDAADPDRIYIRNLKTAAPGVFRFRVAIPTDLKAHLDCRYEVDGQPVKLNQPPESVDVSGIVEVNDESHSISELTIYVNRNSDSWSIGSYSAATNLNCFSPIRDETLLWLDNMHEGVPLSENSTGNDNTRQSIAGLLGVVADGREFGIQYDTRSFAKSEEILLQEIWGMHENKKHKIKFVIHLPMAMESKR